MKRYYQQIREEIQEKETLAVEEIIHFQDIFCRATGLYVACFNVDGRQVTRWSGTESQSDYFGNLVTEEIIQEVLDRVAEGSLEDVAVEPLNDSGAVLGAISVDMEKVKFMTWIVAAVVRNDTDENSSGIRENQSFTEKEYYRLLDLLREVSHDVLQNRCKFLSAEAQNNESQFTNKEISEDLKRSEATTEVVQMLDSDEPIEKVMYKLLQIVGRHLSVSDAQVIELNLEQNTMNVLTEWCGDGVISRYDRTNNIPAQHYIFGDKPIVLSSDAVSSFKYREELEEVGIRAFVSFPLLKHKDRNVYVCFSEQNRSRIWNVNEVKFVSDMTKVLQSILTKRIQKNSLASSYASLEAVLDNVGCGIYVIDENTGEALFLNRAFKLEFAQEIENGTINTFLEKGIPVGNHANNFELTRMSSGQWFDLLKTSIAWVDGRRAVLYSLYEITDKKIYQKKIEQQAFTDFLTGLYNRMCCERDLARNVDTAKKNNTKGALLYLDLDDFKHINDGLGHQYGDVLLKSISHSLQKVEGIENTCYRMGGDEFVIVIPPESFSLFEKIVTDITIIFSKPWYLKNADYYCTMSMGVVVFPDDGDNIQDLIRKADIAMYEAKKNGKNCVFYYSENMEALSNKRLDMEKNMRDATRNNYEEFEVYYQPIIDIQLEGTPCTGAEALIRWNSKELGFISPQDFIPLAEYLGLINPIGNFVLEKACKDCRRWNDNGHPNYKVNVNLSVVQLLQPDIVEVVKNTVEKTGINPRNLTLEVTESLAINDMRKMKEVLGNIKKLGVRIALDDFGTGYSSLNHIREIPFDVIKVDQGFVKDLSEDAYSQSFIRMVAELASAIGVRICVEGIETEAQYKVLEGMKVRLVQGYFFDRPMTLKAFEKKYI